MNTWSAIFSCRTSFRHARIRQTRPLLACIALALALAPAVDAQSGMISGSPNPCTIPGGQSVCTTTASWSSSGTSQVQVWVSLNGGAEAAFATSGTGGAYQNATWIQGPPNSYAFNLYDYSSGSRGALLASTTVTGIYAVTLTWGNTTNSSITPNFVVGDYWTLSISGAPPSASIVLGFSENGGSLQYYTLASTTASGTYYQAAQVTVGSVATFTNQWYVGGVAAGQQYDYEVIRLPDHLSKDSATVLGGCPGSDYGILGHMDWIIEDSGNVAVTSQNNIGLYPWVSYNYGAEAQLPSALYGASPTFGDFVDSPIGYCWPTAYSGATITEQLWIQIEDSGVQDGPVRTQVWEASSSAIDSGILYNSIDVSLSQ